MPEPSSFSEFRARRFLTEQIMRPVNTGRIVHAQLFAGPDGTGKRTAALLAARAMNCEGEGEKPCNRCPSCLQFFSGNSPRLLLIQPEDGSIKVDVIRRMIERVSLCPDAGHLCVIIDQADRMNESAQNALLKTLEEAPDYAVFYLLTAKPSSLLTTIRSRCAMFRFAPLDDETVVDALVQRGIPQTQAKETAREAAGSIGRATSILEDDSFRPMYESAVRALLSVRENADVYAAFQMIAGYKDSARRILEIYETLASRLMRAEHAAAEPDEDAVRALLQRGVRGDRLLSCAVEALKKLTSNVSYQSTMEMLFFDLVNRED